MEVQRPIFEAPIYYINSIIKLAKTLYYYYIFIPTHFLKYRNLLYFIKFKTVKILITSLLKNNDFIPKESLIFNKIVL